MFREASFRSVMAVALTACTWATGCDTTRFAANTAADMSAYGEPTFNSHWDYEFAGEAAPANLMQLESVLRVAPTNQTALLSLSKGYTGYAFGWIEDALERADPSDVDEVIRLRGRARWMYLRSSALAVRVLEQNAEGFGAARRGPLAGFEAFLKSHYASKEHAAALFWAGSALASAINVSRDDPALLAELAHARAMVARSIALDPAYFHASGLMFMAILAADFPRELGGDPEGGAKMFEAVLAKTQRKFHFAQLQYARTYCVRTGNRAKFQALLMEIVDAGDVNPGVRLLNKIARRRAERYLAQADDFF